MTQMPAHLLYWLCYSWRKPSTSDHQCHHDPGFGFVPRFKICLRRKMDQRVQLQRVFSEKWHAVGVALFYGICSVSMNFLNKAVVTSYEFNFPFFIMSCQMIVTVIFLDLLRQLGYLKVQRYSFQGSQDFLPASLCFALHSTLSLSALHGMNIPMYGAIKRCTPLVNLILSVVVLKKAMPSRYLVMSILLITTGCFVASFGDLQFDRNAYFMGMLSVFAQGGYLTLVEKSSDGKRSTLEMVYINGFNTLPFFLIMAMITFEPMEIYRSRSLSCIALNTLGGCLYTYIKYQEGRSRLQKAFGDALNNGEARLIMDPEADRDMSQRRSSSPLLSGIVLHMKPHPKDSSSTENQASVFKL
eukprot:maker-scaffold382_size189932-snap-gene-0.28 protein:Tk03706 transcript:maker-scaffold382_size189932-snap-gene-0.28-mRNA-1 annotation:"hypothetical protein CAPTEDRAFT_101209"